MKLGRIIFITTLCSVLTSCVYSPLSRMYTQWSSDICGRKTFLQRLCTGLVIVFMLPVQIVIMIIDLPLAMLEFFFGVAPFKDPLVKTSSIDFDEHRFKGKQDGEEWLVQRLVEAPESFRVQQLRNGTLLEEYVMTPMASGQLKVHVSRNSAVARQLPSQYRLAELPTY